MSENYKIERVLLLFPMQDGETGPAFKDAFERCGREVTVLDLDRADERDIERACEEFEGELVWAGRERILAPMMPELRKLAGVHRWATYNPDVRGSGTDHQAALDWWDDRGFMNLFRFPHSSVYFTVGLGHLMAWRENLVNAMWLPQGLDDRLHYPPEDITEAERRKFSAEVSFVGGEYGMHKGRSGALDCLQGGPWDEKIWGTRGAPQVRGREHNLVSALSDINLCHSGWPTVECYWSVRAYRVMGAGGFVLANAHQGMAKWLPINGPKRILDYYMDLDDMEAEIEYWLNHPEERKEIAERGRQWALKNTYKKRVAAALNLLESGREYGDEEVFNLRRLSPLDLEPYNEIFETASEAEELAKKDPSPRRRPSQSGSGRQIIRTIADENVVEDLGFLLRSMRSAGWSGSIQVLSPRGSGQAVSGPGYDVIELPDWYREAAPGGDFMYYNSCQLKPVAGDGLNEGDDVLFVDVDTLFLSDPGELFEMLDISPFVYTPAEPGKDEPQLPGTSELFGFDPANRVAANSGVFAFRCGEYSKEFFALWKALSFWGLKFGVGDMTSYNIALTVAGNGAIPASRTWNWLMAYGVDEFEGELLTPSDVDPPLPAESKINILHGAGSGREDFVELRSRLFAEASHEVS